MAFNRLRDLRRCSRAKRRNDRRRCSVLGTQYSVPDPSAVRQFLHFALLRTILLHVGQKKALFSRFFARRIRPTTPRQ